MATSLKRHSEITTKQTYSIAHSAQCKLHIAANRPDRNLRFVLGHAFTLDKVLLRIVEIENYSAKDQFDNSQPSPDNDDPMGCGVRIGETGSLARPKRRISFSNQTKPSDITGANDSNSRKSREKSPPPQPKKNQIPKGYEDDESTSSDDYDEPDTLDYARATNPKSAVHPPANVEDDNDDDGYVDDYDNNEEEDTSLGLTRFASATAAAPRAVPRSPSPPPLSESDSDEDDEPPKSPPAFPDDMVREAMGQGEEVKELNDLYEQIRGCPCKSAHGVAPESKGIWEIKNPGEEGGVRYGVVRV